VEEGLLFLVVFVAANLFVIGNGIAVAIAVTGIVVVAGYIRDGRILEECLLLVAPDFLLAPDQREDRHG